MYFNKLIKLTIMKKFSGSIFDYEMLLFIPLLLYLIWMFVDGITAIPLVFFGKSPESKSGIWALIVIAFFAGWIVNFNRSEIEKLIDNTKGIPIVAKQKIAMLVVTLAFAACSLFFSGDSFVYQLALPQVFLSLGSICLIVVLPWKSFDLLEQARQSPTRMGFYRLRVEAVLKTGECVILQILEGNNVWDDADKVARKYLESNGSETVQVVAESGYSEPLRKY
jgi:hypothetical protein